MKNYDVIIVGGGTSGCAAAYMCGKLRLKTLLIEKNSFLGGTMTSSLVTPAMKTSDNQINTEFFNVLSKELKDGQITYGDGNEGWFNPELTKIALDNLMNKSNVEVLFNTTISDVKVSNRHINELIFKNDSSILDKILSVSIGATYFIDATGNCEIGKISNCRFLNKKNEFQPTNLRFIMGGVDVKYFGDWLLDFDHNRDITTVYEINGETHLSTAYTWDDPTKWALAPLFDDAVINGVLKNTDKNYFQLFTIPKMHNSIAFNAPRILFDTEIDPLDKYSVSKALKDGRQAILRLCNFCIKYLPGFKNAYLQQVANELGIRVSRRIVGKYIYTKNDLISGKKFKNPVLIGNYPIDVHSNKKEASVLQKVNQDYEVPLECLMSDDIDNLFVIGRCISADFEAQGALRIQPACFSMGVGIAKYIKNIVEQTD